VKPSKGPCTKNIQERVGTDEKSSKKRGEKGEKKREGRFKGKKRSSESRPLTLLSVFWGDNLV